MTPTLRRLNDRERYFGLTWAGWLSAAGAGALVYGAVRLSPFGVKPTVTIVVLLLGALAMVTLAVSGQALSPRRHLTALVRYRTRPKTWTLPTKPDRRGLVLVDVPDPDNTDPAEPAVGVSLEERAESRLPEPSNNGCHPTHANADA